MASITFKNIVKTYDNGVTVIPDLNLEIKDTKDIMAYIEEALSESNATLKLKELEDAEMIKINSLNENYQSYNSVVIAGGNNGKLGKEQYENIDKILIETDSPYLAPEPKRGRRNDSRNVKLVAQKIADFKQIELEQVAKATYENAMRIFEI